MTSSPTRRAPRARSPRQAPAVDDVCVTCDEPTRRPGIELCSRSCLAQARAEIEANAAQAKRADHERRRELMARNGVLTSALIRWTPA